MYIAIDFDGTLCEVDYPRIGRPRKDVVEKIIECKKAGHTIILNTLRKKRFLYYAVEWCVRHGILFDYVNENPVELIDKWGDSRKISATYYIDDRAPGSIEWFLCHTVKEMEELS